MTTADLYNLISERDRAFMDWLTAPYNRRWCISARTTPRLTQRYGHVITPRQVEKKRAEWEHDHPITVTAA